MIWCKQYSHTLGNCEFYNVFVFVKLFEKSNEKKNKLKFCVLDNAWITSLISLTRRGRACQCTSRLPNPNWLEEPIRGKENITRSQWHSVEITSKLCQARETSRDQVAIGFNFGVDWLRERRRFSDKLPKGVKQNRSIPGSLLSFNYSDLYPEKGTVACMQVFVIQFATKTSKWFSWTVEQNE